MASRVPVYHGPFRKREAERLLWRAGFGPKPGEAVKVAKKGLKRAVDDLLSPPKARLIGPSPTDDNGAPLAPRDAWGHDHLWWLDRMVRSNQQLIERMTLVWHDWFATSNDGVGSQKFMLDQNEFLRSHALGSFESMLLGLTKDPAMLIWLNGIQNTKWSPNENYARELMELFTLGAGRGYTEDDVREQARALTGWRVDWDDGVGYDDFRFDPSWHDARRQDHLRQERQVRLAGRRAACASSTRPTPSYFVDEALELLHPDRRRRRPRSRRSSRSTSAPTTG